MDARARAKRHAHTLLKVVGAAWRDPRFRQKPERLAPKKAGSMRDLGSAWSKVHTVHTLPDLNSALRMSCS